MRTESVRQSSWDILGKMATANAAPVDAFFGAVGSRSFDAARRTWSDSGVWHLGGRHEFVGDYTPDEYIEFLAGWFERYPDYAVTDFSLQRHGTDVVTVHLVTTGGCAPGEASGLMIFRTLDGVIAEGWSIPTSWQGKYPF